MKVCFIAGTLGRGGAERQLLYMLRALKCDGIDARVLCLTTGEAYETEIKKLGVEIEWIGTSRNRISRLQKIIRNIKKKPVDIIQSVHFYTNIYAGFTGRLLRIANIGAIRSDLSFELAQNNFYGKWQLTLPNYLIANSELARNRAINNGIKSDKIDLLSNAVEMPLEPVKELSRDYVSILFAGRLSKEKRPELFVKLAARLMSDLPDLAVKFIIAGDGPLRAELESSVAKSGLSSDRFSFLGQLAEMDEIYRQSDILVLTSAHEGTPNVVLEAMAFGIPVVATNVGGVGEIVDAERGFLLGKDDFDGVCVSVAKLINDTQLRRRIGQNGKRYVFDNHSLEYLRKDLTGIYGRLLRGYACG